MHYRIYLLEPSGRIRTGSDYESETDLTALTATKLTLADGERAEVWQGSRKVGNVEKPRAGTM